MRRRMLFAALALALLLTGCGGQMAEEIPSTPEDADTSDTLTEADVLDLYATVSSIYNWFDLAPPSLDRTDSRTEDGVTYYKVEEASAPPITLTSQAGMEQLRRLVDLFFSAEIADALFSESPEQFRDFDGVLYATDGGRGSNIYLLGKAVTPEQVDENHWTVTVTFYADSWAFEKPSTTVGYSQAVLDLEHTADGWKFTSFVPSDGLDLEAETVFSFAYTDEGFSELNDSEDCSDLKLACWLLHADGGYAEGPSDTLTRRFLEDPGAWFAALSVFPDSPWEHADTVMTAPVSDTYAWYGEEEQARLTEILDTYEPRNEQEQTLLDILRAAQREAAG